MATHTLDIAVFRATFPAFASEVLYPDPRIQAQWNMATGFISPDDGPLMEGATLQSVMDLLTAHLLQISTWIAAGQVYIGVVVSGTVDKVQVALAAPANRKDWNLWLMCTPYGQQLMALLSFASAGGWMIGGLPERDAFRRVGGGFGAGWC